VLLTDLDHQVPPETMARAIAMRSPGRRIYKIVRRGADGARRKPHANTFILSRARFLELYGYDEDFCGAYGADDLWFLRWQRYHGSRIRYLPRRYFIMLRSATRGDPGSHALRRDRSTNAELYRSKRRACETLGPEHGHSRRFLDFSWQVALDRRRPAPPSPGGNRWWDLRWRWNKLTSGWPR
jgi:hypothetical protein